MRIYHYASNGQYKWAVLPLPLPVLLLFFLLLRLAIIYWPLVSKRRQRQRQPAVMNEWRWVSERGGGDGAEGEWLAQRVSECHSLISIKSRHKRAKAKATAQQKQKQESTITTAVGGKERAVVGRQHVLSTFNDNYNNNKERPQKRLN